MNTDEMPDFRDPKSSKLLLKKETEEIIGCGFTKLRVGLILNFKHARLEWERIVL